MDRGQTWGKSRPHYCGEHTGERKLTVKLYIFLQNAWLINQSACDGELVILVGNENLVGFEIQQDLLDFRSRVPDVSKTQLPAELIYSSFSSPEPFLSFLLFFPFPTRIVSFEIVQIDIFPLVDAT